MPPKRRSMPRTERLEARVATDLKARLCRAAALEGRTLTEFVTDHLDQAARKTIESWERWELGQRDREEFVRALLEPPRAQPGPRRGGPALSGSGALLIGPAQAREGGDPSR